MPDANIDLTRSFSEGRKWRLWNGPRLDAAIPGEVVDYDDPSVVVEDVRWYGGVEVHELVLVVAVYGRMGEKRVLGPIYRENTTPEGLDVLRGNLAPYNVVRYLMETSGVYHIPVAWHFREWFPNSQVVVMNSTDLKRYIRGTRKNDLVDATRLAQVASFDELLKASYVPDRSHYIQREMARYRTRLSREVAGQKNRIKKVMVVVGLPWAINFGSQPQRKGFVQFLQQPLSLGEFLPTWPGRLGTKALDLLGAWGSVVLDEEARQLILDRLRDLAVMEELERLAAGRLEERSKGSAEIQEATAALAEFPGLGYLDSLCVLAEVGAVARFPSAGHLLVYAGIAPCGGTSGVGDLGATEETTVATDVPNQRCNKHLKGILTRVAVGVLRVCSRSARDDGLYAYARVLKETKMAKKQRIFKIAAKVGRILYHVLATGEQYDGNVETKNLGSGAAGDPRSKAVKRKQRYRKEREARLLASRQVELLVEKLRECGVGEDAIRAILEVA